MTQEHFKTMKARSETFDTLDEDDRLECYDIENFDLEFYVGSNFGCIHFKSKE